MRCTLILLLALFLGTLAVPAQAVQSRAKGEQGCPWCKDDPALLAKLGAVRHGPFEFARGDTQSFAQALPSGEWIFLETPHLRFASSLGPERLSTKDQKRLAPELDALRAVLPGLPKKVKQLDPWLRLHLLARRSEAFYARFQQLLGVTDADFPAEREFGMPFMGLGAYLGEPNKFELVLHASRGTHKRFTKELMGASVTDALRWHLSPEHKLLASIPAEDGDLRKDRWLYPHCVHLMSHLFLCAYKHFSYDPPVWLDEGLAHALEREQNPLSTTMDGDEGSGPHRGGHQDWSGMHAKLAKSSKTPSFALMLRWKAFHDMDQTAHRAAWSRVSFLMDAHPEEFARFIGALKGQLDEQGYPNGDDLVGLQRKLLRELWEWTPQAFDEAWRAWALEQP